MAELNGAKVLHGGLWQKRLKLFYAIFVRPIFFLLYAGILAQVLPTMCANLRKKSNIEKYLANTRNANFWENGKKIG